MNMNALADSPPEAYESNVPVQARHTIQLGDPIGPHETPEQAMARAEAVCLQAMNGDLGEGRRVLVATEAGLYGIELNAETIPEFLEARRQKINECDQSFAESFRQRAPVLAGRLAEDIAVPGEDPEGLRTMLGKRLEPVWTSVNDPLVWLDEEVYPDQFMAHHDDVSRGMTLNYAAVVTAAARKDHPLALDKEFFDALAEHESMHAMMAVWYDPEGEERRATLTNGLFFDNGHGEWLNEATIEEYRESAFGENNFVYETPVLALAVADAADPDFKRARLRSAILNEDHGSMIGRLETIFGPGMPEALDDVIGQAQTGALGIGAYKATLMKLLPEDKRPAGGRAFDKVMRKLDRRHDLLSPRID